MGGVGVGGRREGGEGGRKGGREGRGRTTSVRCRKVNVHVSSSRWCLHLLVPLS